MSDEPRLPQAIDYARWFPWVRLFRALPLALNLKLIVLAALGVFVLEFGWAVIDVGTGQTREISLRTAWRYRQPPEFMWDAAAPLSSSSINAMVQDWLATAASQSIEPARVLIRPFQEMLALNQGWRLFLRGLLAAVWMAIVWGVFGGAIGRIVASRAASGRSPSMFAALKFAARRLGPLTIAPLCPMVGIGLFATLCAGLGAIRFIPSAGEAIGSALFGLALIFGLAMAVLLIGWIAAWPLMTMAVVVDDEDQYEALSRGYHYILQRPLLFGGSVALLIALGAFYQLAVGLVFSTTVHLAHWGIAWSLPDSQVLDLMLESPPNPHGGWLEFMRLLAYGSCFAFFWASVALTYMLMRLDVDGVAWETVSPKA